MKYEIVELEEKVVAGISVRTSFGDSKAGAEIGNLWQRYFSEGLYEKIPGRKNEKCLGMYSDYSLDEKEEYKAFVGCEVKEATEELKKQFTVWHIPAGKYAKFVVEGDVVKDVQKFWSELSGQNLDRAYTFDYEEYQDMNPEHGVIHIFISLK